MSLFNQRPAYKSLLDSESQPGEHEERSFSPELEDDEEDDFVVDTSSKYASKKRSCCGATIYTPNSSRFKNNWHSRVLYKFPFLMEMFYWVVTYLIYRASHILSQRLFSDDIWDIAQENGLRLLAFEQFSMFRFLFPVHELSIQKWFMDGHEELLTFLNRTYALIHIPGSV